MSFGQDLCITHILFPSHSIYIYIYILLPEYAMIPTWAPVIYLLLVVSSFLPDLFGLGWVIFYDQF